MYSIIDEMIAQVEYYDKIVEADMTLRVGKKVQYAISDKEMKGVLSSWNYKEFNYTLWANVWGFKLTDK